MLRATLALSILAASVVVGPARSETVTVHFTSTVTLVQNQPVFGISTTVGAPVSGVFTYDRTAVDANPDPTLGTYDGIALQLTLDGHPIVGSPQFWVYDINSPNDLFSAVAGTPLTGSAITVDGVAQTDGYVALSFSEMTGTVLTSDALPLATQIPFLEVSQFNLYQQSTNGVIIYDNVTITGIQTDDLKITSIADVRNDQGRQVRMRFNRSGLDAQGSATPILQYEAYRRLSGLAGPAFADAAGAGERLREARRQGMVSDAGFLLADWEFVRAIPAHGESEYNMIVPTLADSSAENGIPWSAFFIRAATADPYTFYDSAVDSGYSVDNLAPNVPASFAVVGRIANNLVLQWNANAEADFRFYSLHRGASPGFAPTLANRVAAQTGTGYVDVGAGASLPVYYKLSATDFAGNQSGFAAASTVGALEATATLPVAFALHPVTPNPAPGASFVRFDLPKATRVRLAILDVGGRVVRVLVDDLVLGAGTHRADWDGRSAEGATVPAGIYFYSLKSEGLERVRRLALVD